ncbi:hypothetical protein BDQ12DRAFT_163316 [Crucibulum laeve]|uniref:Uncharacterized protein n=1 Tax=Crucibulum laeve TaxID=68775 RepID=A0A5C3MC72_9AGAR|nr:hypothetical protein BDQ12DRAFT_163316 [Crucibulum laeve]
MIHLDRNHHPSPLDTHEKQLDSHPILSWEDHLSHDDQPFQQDFIPDATTTTTASERVTSDNDTVPPKPGPVTPIDANDPAHTHSSSPASPADGNSTSPTRDRSSSLSPVPETGTPHTQTDTRSSPPAPSAAEEKEAPEEVPTREEEEEPEEVRVADKASRVSTPLSELSPPPPDQEDEPEPPKPEEQQKENPPEAPKEAEAEAASVQPEQSLLSIRQSPPNNLPSPSTPLTPIAPNTSSGNDPKVVSILELNVELLKICLAFQTRGIGGGDARFQQYSTRLQSNLTWLAAAADHSRVGNHSNMQLPIMDAPQPVDFAPMDRIRQIYVELPSIFAKEIARRHTMGISATQTLPPSLSGSGTPGTPVNTNLKRDREDSPADSISKRRDTGEGKGMNMGMGIGMGNPGAMLPPPTALPMASPATSQFSLPMTNGSSGPVLGGGPQQQGPQSHGIDAGIMPGGTPGLENTSEAQLAASQRERVRQEQMRAVQQQRNAARQISPTSSGGPGGVGAGMPRGQPPMQGNAAAGPSNLGGSGGGSGGPGGGMGMQMSRANMQQAYQVLQQPNHPFVQYMQSQVPGFQQMSVQMQVQKMVMAQVCLVFIVLRDTANNILSVSGGYPGQ